MFGLVVFTEVLPGAMQPGFHCRNAGGKDFGNLGVTAALLDEGEERAILGPQLRESVAQGVEFLGVDGAGRLGDVFVFGAKGEKNATQLLPAELIDAGVPSESKEPRFKLGGRLEAFKGTNHFYEHLLGEVFDVIRATGHGIDKPGHAMLIIDDELMLGGLIALLSPADQISQRGRCSCIHAKCIVV